MKKTVVLILLVLLLSVSFSAAAVDYENKETKLLSALNIVVDDERDAEETVTRGEFASYIVRFMGLEAAPSMYDGSFNDVTEYNDNCDAIYYLKKNNVVSGAGDGNFYPDLPITKKFAAIILSRVLGYGALPGNIENYAAGLSLTIMNDDSLTYAELDSLLFKALESDVMVWEVGTNENYVKHQNYLSKTFGVYEGKGIVKSNSLTTLDATGSVYKDKVMIDNHLLMTGECNIDNLLGLAVDYYYMEAGWPQNDENEDTLICAAVAGRNKVTEIFAKDIYSFDGYKLKYYSGNNVKTIDINNNIDLIYNGVACPDYELAMLSPQAGKITYIDNGSGSACVKVERYKNSIVSIADEEYIFLKDGTKIEFDEFDDGKLTFYDKNGNIAENVPVNSVLSTYYSEDGSVLKAVYSTDVIDNATITGMDEEYIETEAGSFFVSKLYLGWNSAIGSFAGKTYKIFLDAYGEVTKIEKASGSENFAYLLDIGEVSGSRGTFAKILLETDDIEVIECDKKIKVNGDDEELNELKTALQYENSRIDQLITYKVNSEGKISAINTAVNRDTYKGTVADKDIDEFKISYMGGSSDYYKTATKVFGTSCPVDDATKVFFVSDKPKETTEDYYWAGSISSLANDDQAGSVIGYNTTSKLSNAEAMVVYGAGEGGKIGSETRVAVVKKIANAKNEDGDLRTRITFITAGKLVAYNLKEDIKIEDYNLSEGDLIRFAIDRRYEVSAIETLCDLKKDGTMALRYGEKNNYANTENGGGAVFRIVSGSVYDYADGLMCLSKGDPNGIDLSNPQFEYYRGIQNAFICIIDGDEITSGSAEDIVRYTDNSAEYSKAFITTRYNAVVDVIIYK